MSKMRLAEIEQFRPVLCDCQIEWFKLIDQKLDELGYGDGYSFINESENCLREVLRLVPTINWIHVWITKPDYFTFYCNGVRYFMHTPTYNEYYKNLKHYKMFSFADDLKARSHYHEFLHDDGSIPDVLSHYGDWEDVPHSLARASRWVVEVLTSSMAGALTCVTCGKVFVDDELSKNIINPGQYPEEFSTIFTEDGCGYYIADSYEILGVMKEPDIYKRATAILTKHRENLTK